MELHELKRYLQYKLGNVDRLSVIYQTYNSERQTIISILENRVIPHVDNDFEQFFCSVGKIGTINNKPMLYIVFSWRTTPFSIYWNDLKISIDLCLRFTMLTYWVNSIIYLRKWQHIIKNMTIVLHLFYYKYGLPFWIMFGDWYICLWFFSMNLSNYCLIN